MSIANSRSMTAFFDNAENMYIGALQDGSSTKFLEQFQQNCTLLSQLVIEKAISLDTGSRIFSTIKSIQCMTEAFLNLHNEGDVVIKKALHETNSILDGAQRISHCSKDKQDSLNSQFLRRWFLEHIDHPFPSTEIKEELAELTNAKLEDLASRDALPKYGPASAIKPITKNQCQLWFINTRRRSTWTEFYREYAFSDEAIMTRLVSILKGESEITNGTTKALARLLAYGENRRTKEWSGDQLKERVHNCKQHWIVIMEWLEQRPHEQQSDWLSQAIDEATSEYDQLRRGKRDEQRKIREFKLQKARAYHSEDDEDADHISSRKRAKKGKTIERAAKPTAAGR